MDAAAPLLPRGAGADPGLGGHPPRPAQGGHAGPGAVPRRVFPADPDARPHPAGHRPGPPVPAPGQPVALPRRRGPGGHRQRAPPHLADGGPHPEPGRAPLRAAPGASRPARVHAAGGRHPPPAPRALQRLRGPLLPRHPRDPRRGHRARAQAGGRSAHQRGGRGARAAHGRRGAAAVRSRPARGAAGHRWWTSSSSPPTISTRAPASPPSRISSSSTRRWTCRASRTSRCRPARSRPSTARSDVWSAIRSGDVLAHHPYHSFDAVTRFVSEAAVDPRVLAIKMTLYRVSPTSPIAQALTLAAENGKEVAVLVELQARFDEEANIRWARALEEVGAHVVYGLPGYKTHCKACLVVRQESDGIRRYCHLATGNYNARTGGIYGDFGLFTCRESFGEDVTELFNMLTGYTRPRRLPSPAGGAHRAARRLPRPHPPRGRARPARPARAHRRQDEQPGGPDADRGALPGQPGRRRDRPDRARHLLPAPGHPRPVGSHPGDLDRGPLPRARPRLLLPERRRAGVLAGLRRLDAPQPRPPRGDRLPGAGRAPAGPDPRGAGSAAQRYREGARDPARRQLGPRPGRRWRRRSAPRSVSTPWSPRTAAPSRSSAAGTATSTLASTALDQQRVRRSSDRW